jgi:hypothetical protein
MKWEKVEIALMVGGLAAVWIGGMVTGFCLSLLRVPVKNPWRSVP